MKFGYFIVFFFILSFNASFAQNKQALIIGINDYYFEKGVLSPQSLKGCVNDAKSMKEMIVSHFGFPQKNITELYNTQATQKSILSEMMNLLTRCKAGDNAFIYYSGHGLLLDNSFSSDKKNQAIVPSDVYQKYRSYILNQDLAAIFNKFIDKKVTLTVIFDCCYSWSVEYMVPGNVEVFKEKDAVQRYIPTLFYDDFNTYLIDTLYQYDSLTAKYLPYIVNAATPTEVVNQLYEFNAQDSTYQINLLSSLRNERSIPGEGEDIKTKKIIQEIPSKRSNSNFLFISGTNNVEKGLEKTDLSKNRHGVFTRTLIDMVNRNSPALSAADLFAKVTEHLKKQFIRSQTPSIVGAENRMKTNLFALDNTSLTTELKTTCKSISNNKIILNKGAAAGLAVGNTVTSISNPSVSAVITNLKGDDSCVAEIKKSSNRSLFSLSAVTVGDEFKVTDWFTRSQPIVRVYIPNDSITFLQLDAIFKKYILPIRATDTAFIAFEEDRFWCSKIYMNRNFFTHYFNNKTYTAPLQNLNAATIHNVNSEDYYFIYLPVPTELSVALKNKCRKDQNMQLVDNPLNADISFYCAYSNKEKRPVFICSTETIGNNRTLNSHARSEYYVSGKNSTEVIAASIYKLMLEFASKRGWLNFYTRK